jgi:hypothetical protein
VSNGVSTVVKAARYLSVRLRPVTTDPLSGPVRTGGIAFTRG